MSDKGAALVYCRVSTTDQAVEGTSLDSQEALNVAHAERLGYAVGRITREVYSGAELWDRPLLTRDRADVASHTFQALIAYSTDRLSRDPIHLAIIAEECERYGCELVFVSEPLENTDEGKLLRYVIGFSNKKEREKIRERSLRGKPTRILSGKVSNMGDELYGYRRDKVAGVRVVYEPEAAIVRRVYEALADLRLSYGSIAKQLNDEGVPAPGAAKAAIYHPERHVYWKAHTIYRMVHTTAYKGEEIGWRWHRQAQPRLDPVTGTEWKGKYPYRLVLRPESEQRRLPDGVTPPIVSAELWERAQIAALKQLGDHTRNESTPYLLRGLVYCGTCGKKMWPHWSRKSGSNPNSPTVRTYRCATNNSPTGCCGGGLIRADECEEWAWGKVAAALRDPDVIAAELKRRQDEGPNITLANDLETARRNAAKCERDQSRLIRKHSESEDESAFPWALVEREVKRLENEKLGRQKTIGELTERIARQQHAVIGLEHLYVYCTHASAQLEHAGFNEKRTALLALDVAVRGNGKDWEITGMIPLDLEADVLNIASPATPHRPDT